MRQPRRMSFAEACVNTSVGFGVNLAVQLLLYPLFGMHVGLVANLQISAVFTVVSVARGYFLRRSFDWWHWKRP